LERGKYLVNSSLLQRSDIRPTIRTGQIGARKINPMMPWGFYRNMHDDDLKSLCAFIGTLKPVRHNLDNSVEPTMCPLCGSKHGLGEKNHK
jgi:hypothetical protein